MCVCVSITITLPSYFFYSFDVVCLASAFSPSAKAPIFSIIQFAKALPTIHPPIPKSADRITEQIMPVNGPKIEPTTKPTMEPIMAQIVESTAPPLLLSKFRITFRPVIWCILHLTMSMMSKSRTMNTLIINPEISDVNQTASIAFLIAFTIFVNGVTIKFVLSRLKICEASSIRLIGTPVFSSKLWSHLASINFSNANFILKIYYDLIINKCIISISLKSYTEGDWKVMQFTFTFTYTNISMNPERSIIEFYEWSIAAVNVLRLWNFFFETTNVLLKITFSKFPYNESMYVLL